MGPSAGNDTGGSEDLHRLSAVVVALQREAQTQGPMSTRPDGENDTQNGKAPQGSEPPFAPTEHHRPHSGNRFHVVHLTGMLLIALAVGWSAGWYFHRAPAPAQELAQGVNIDAVVEQIIKVEFNGDPTAKNKRSSATGLGQFLG